MFGSGSPPAPDSALSEKLKLCPEGMVHDLNNLIFNFVFPPARTRSSGTILPQRRKLQPDPSSASVQESNPTDQIQHSQAQPSPKPSPAQAKLVKVDAQIKVKVQVKGRAKAQVKVGTGDIGVARPHPIWRWTKN